VCIKLGTPNKQCRGNTAALLLTELGIGPRRVSVFCVHCSQLDHKICDEPPIGLGAQVECDQPPTGLPVVLDH
jgi:hypothetical protein